MPVDGQPERWPEFSTPELSHSVQQGADSNEFAKSFPSLASSLEDAGGLLTETIASGTSFASANLWSDLSGGVLLFN